MEPSKLKQIKRRIYGFILICVALIFGPIIALHDDLLFCYVWLAPSAILVIFAYICKEDLVEIEKDLNEKDLNEKELEKLKKSTKEPDFFPFICRLLQFNTKPFEKQIKILEQLYGKKVQTIIKNYQTKEENWQQHYTAIKAYPWEKKRDLVRLLFQLAIAEDGIRNDEWNFLMTVIRNIGFNKKWIDHFTYHYYSLRTEFDYKEEEHTTKIETGTTSTLLPYLRVLGLDEAATADDIRKAYHQKALEYHPDLLKNANQTKVCEKQMVMINEAYKKLTGSQMGER